MRAHLCVYIRFVNVVSYLLPKLHGMLKTHCLECVFSRAEVIPDIYLLLKTKGFTQIMAHRFAPYTHTHIYEAWTKKHGQLENLQCNRFLVQDQP